MLAYCFGVAEVFDYLADRTSAAVAIGVPALTVIAVGSLAPRWGNVAIATLVMVPLAIALMSTVVAGFSSTSRR